MRANEPIHVRGHRNGLYITVDETVPTEEICERVLGRIASLGSFIRGASIVLEVGSHSLDDEALRAMQKRFEREHGLRISQLITASDETRQAAEILRIRAAPTLLKQRNVDPNAGRAREPNAITIRSTLRGGALERFLEGSILVMGDVNPGAEVVASADVVVLGTVRGVVHAGAMGDEGAVVIALNLNATQLRIADRIARAPEGGRKTGIRPEIARIEDGQIVVSDFEGL